MDLLIFCLVSYGITNIIVNGTIFEPLKDKLLEIKQRILEYKEESKCYSGLQLEHYFWVNKRIKRHLENIKQYYTTDSEKSDTLSKIVKSFEDLPKIFKRQQKYIDRIYKVITFILGLTSCMMCTGFWIGVLLAMMTLWIPITLCGTTVTLVSVTTILATFINVFLLGCLSSGVNWIIYNIVNHFSEEE